MVKISALERQEASLQVELDGQRKLVDVDHYDVTLRELLRMAVAQELRRAPEYQRQFRWEHVERSRLIESVFLGLPIPSIFVATNVDGTWELVDGLQRISTLLHFVGDPPQALEQIGESKPLVLDGLEKLPSWNGLRFRDLPTPLQLAFFKRAFRVTALSDKSDPLVRFDMFERLNRGGIALTPQEVRACIYRGPFAALIDLLADDAAFTSIIKVQRGKQNDGTRQEVVLKFFAYLDRANEFDGKVTKFLNNFMQAASSDYDLRKAEGVFKATTQLLATALKGKPLLREGYHVTPLNQLEAAMVGIALILRDGDKPRSPPAGWVNDSELVYYSTKGTNTPTMLRGRIERAKRLFLGDSVKKSFAP